MSAIEPDEIIDGNRGPDGKYALGRTGNPGGRPKLPDAFKSRGPAALAELARIAEDPKDEDHFKAVCTMIERIYGRVPNGEQADADRLSAFLAGLSTRLADARQLAAADALEDGDDA